MWRNSDFKIYFSVLKIYFKAMAPPFMTIYVSAKAATQSFVTFFLCRVLSGGFAMWFRAATQSFGAFFLRRVLFNEFLRGERVGQARDEVSN